MRKVAVLFLVMIAVQLLQAQVDVRMGFVFQELHLQNGIRLYDTCAIVTGATRGVDNSLGEIDIPAIPPGFYAAWSDSNLLFKTELVAPPFANHPPYAVDFFLINQLNISTDTFSISWTDLPVQIDSIYIDDYSGVGAAGAIVHKIISHASSMPDSLLWANSLDDLHPVNEYRIRVFYDQSVATTDVHELVSRISSPKIFIYPNPAHHYFELPANGCTPGSKLIVTNSLGRIVQQSNVEDGSTSISVIGLPRGSYTITIADHLSVAHALVIVE